jgi:hypothetical protein
MLATETVARQEPRRPLPPFRPLERPKALLEKYLSPPEHRYGVVHVTLPLGWTLADVLKPEAWSNLAHRFRKPSNSNDPDRVGNRVELRIEDHSFYADLYIRAVGDRSMTVQCTGPQRDPVTGKACPIDLETGLPWVEAKKLDFQAYEFRWNITKRGFDIIRKSDREIVGDAAKFPTREQAQAWAEKTLTAG